MPSTDFVVARNDLQQCKVIETQLPDVAALPDDALLVKVTRFAFTANNITYAVLGDHLKYWQLFPAPEGFGNVPVWGFGEVMASKHPAIAAGETLFDLDVAMTREVRKATVHANARNLPSVYRSRSLRLKILPVASRGIASMNWMSFGTLKLASRPRKNSCTAAGDSAAFASGSMQANSRSPNSSSGTPNTAQSRTPSMPISAFSISAG